MQLIKIDSDCYKLRDILTPEGLGELEEYLSELEFKKKKSPHFCCNVVKMTNANKKFAHIETLVKAKSLLEIVQKVFGIPLRLSDKLEVLKLKKGDFLSTHIDDYNAIQGVFHLKSCSMVDGGILTVNEKVILPEKNSFVFFKGKTPHSVSKYLIGDPRYSMSLGFR